jgi:hypothetical protein
MKLWRLERSFKRATSGRNKEFLLGPFKISIPWLATYV